MYLSFVGYMPWNERVFMILIGVMAVVFIFTVVISLKIRKQKEHGEFDFKKHAKKIAIIEMVILILCSIFLILKLTLLFTTGDIEHLIGALLLVGIIIPSIVVYRKIK